MKSNNIFASIQKWIAEHKTEILGGSVLLAGIILIWFSKEIILNVILFLGGAILLYIGFKLLRITSVTNFVDQQINKLLKNR